MRSRLSYFANALILVLMLPGNLVWGDEADTPGNGWSASRYETLWTKSPFSVATPEAGTTSSEYSLTGIAQIDGVSYASLTEKQSNEHFLVSSDKPARGVTLVSIARGKDANGTQAILQKDGQSITLEIEKNSQPAVVANQPGNMPQPQGIPMPGGYPQPPGIPSQPGQNMASVPGQMPPPVATRVRSMHIPTFPRGLQVPPPPPAQPTH